MTELLERLRSSAKAFRKNPVYTQDGDGVYLSVQADELDEAAALIEAQAERVRELEALLKPFADAWRHGRCNEVAVEHYTRAALDPKP